MVRLERTAAVRAASALLVVWTAGCSSMEHQRLCDEGLALEEQALRAEQAGQPSEALARFRAGEAKFREALALAEADRNATTLRYTRMKLAHVLAGQGRAQEPSANPAGSWRDARAAYAAAAEFAGADRFLKLTRQYTLAEAACARPDRNPAGSWPDAAALYARAADLAARYDDDEGQGEALRLQASCVLEGRRAPLNAEAQALLEQARRLGDALAEEWLEEGGACGQCQARLPAGAKFCPQCGANAAPGACGSCEAALEPGAKFCSSCGARAP